MILSTFPQPQIYIHVVSRVCVGENCEMKSANWRVDETCHRVAKKFTPEPSEEVYFTVDTVSFRNFNQENFSLNFAKFSIFQKTKPTLLGYIGVPATPTSSNSLSLMMIKNTSRQPRKIKLLWGMKAKATRKKKLFFILNLNLKEHFCELNDEKWRKIMFRAAPKKKINLKILLGISGRTFFFLVEAEKYWNFQVKLFSRAIFPFERRKFIFSSPKEEDPWSSLMGCSSLPDNWIKMLRKKKSREWKASSLSFIKNLQSIFAASLWDGRTFPCS